MTMADIRSEFKKLSRMHKRLSNKCKHLGKFNGYRRNSWDQCAHDSMNYGGINRNTDCELANCPLIIEE